MRAKVLSTDVTFTRMCKPGPGCLCSRCLLPIFDEKPVKSNSKKIKGVVRYHSKCWKSNVLKETHASKS